MLLRLADRKRGPVCGYATGCATRVMSEDNCGCRFEAPERSAQKGARRFGASSSAGLEGADRVHPSAVRGLVTDLAEPLRRQPQRGDVSSYFIERPLTPHVFAKMIGFPPLRDLRRAFASNDGGSCSSTKRIAAVRPGPGSGSSWHSVNDLDVYVAKLRGRRSTRSVVACEAAPAAHVLVRRPAQRVARLRCYNSLRAVHVILYMVFYSKHIHSLLNDHAANVLPHWLDVVCIGGNSEVAVYLALASQRLETPLDEVRARLPLQGAYVQRQGTTRSNGSRTAYRCSR